jgi:hypothetical protein
VLPARFGTRYADEAGLRSAVASRAQELAGRLAAVRGRVEIGIHAWWDGAAAAPPVRRDSGRAYLQGRLEEHRRAARLTALLEDALAPLAADQAAARPRPGGGVALAFLVDRARLGPFRDAADSLGRDEPGLRLVCTGPWAPYSFAGDPHRSADGW